jgi:glycosyltransferase involved in cell wall biosynthesis
MPDPRISIVIPTYNHQEYIGQAIQSVLEQTYQNYEIIVIDDGSQDNTREVVAKFGDRVRYIWQKNQGLSGARNTGIKISAGKYIGLLDSDDLYEPDFLVTLIQILDNNPQIDAVYCSARTVDKENRNLPQIIGKALPPDKFHAALLKGGFFPPSCMVAHSYCYKSENRLFDESLRRVEDLDLWLKFAQYYKVLGTDYPLVRYRILPQSLSTDPQIVLTHRIEVLNKHYSAMVNHPISIPLDEAIGRSYIAAAIEYLQLHNVEQAFQKILDGFCRAPELMIDFCIYYELALGDQPRGYRGSFSTYDLDYNAAILLGLLDRLFSEDDIFPYKKKLECKAYANANKALGYLAYGSRNFHAARSFFKAAITFDPTLLREIQLIMRIIKSLLPPKLVDKAKDFRKFLSSSITFLQSV